MTRQAVVQQKLAANARRLRQPDRLRELRANGVRASAVGVEARKRFIIALQQARARTTPFELSAEQVAAELRKLGTGETLLLFDWHVADEPAFVASRTAVADAVAKNAEFFGLDGFIVIDGGGSCAAFVDIDDRGVLLFEYVNLNSDQDRNAQD